MYSFIKSPVSAIIKAEMKNLFQKTIKTFLILGIVFSVQNTVFAQDVNSTDVQNPVQITMSPATPNAGDSVTLQLSSDSIDLDSAKITWYTDGILGEEGYGQKSLTITAKDAGDATNIKAVVETADGTTNEASVGITPAGPEV